MPAITSGANPLLKEVRRARARGTLTEDGWSVAETFHLLEEALRSRCAVKAVLAAESAVAAVNAVVQGRVAVTVVQDALLAGVTGTESSQGVIALVKAPAWTIDQLFAGTALVVVLDGIQDPGNAGTIARTAEAFGATGAMFVKGTVSPHNGKALRASAGSLFRLPFVSGIEAAAARAAIAEHGVKLFAAVPARTGVRPLTTADFAAPCALAIGSEAHGVGAELRAGAEEVAIPTAGVESLNAAVAAGILLYEARRQREGR